MFQGIENVECTDSSKLLHIKWNYGAGNFVSRKN